MSLSRDVLAAEGFDAFIQQMLPPGYMQFLTPEEREESLQAALASAPDGDIWLFGYGSLMWNPAIRHLGHQVGMVRGWHRQFCLWTPIGRGTPERPGLVLGLESGGSCRGLSFRIERTEAEEELRLVWRREMLSGAYRPRWVTVETADGPHRALTFVINRDNPRYTGRLPESETVAVLGCAAGHLGSSRDYLLQALQALESFGIEDRRMRRLAAMVALIPEA